MNLTDVNKQIENLDLEKSTKNAIFALIDLKINSDMEKILERLDTISNKMETKISMLFWFIGALAILITVYKFIA